MSSAEDQAELHSLRAEVDTLKTYLHLNLQLSIALAKTVYNDNPQAQHLAQELEALLEIREGINSEGKGAASE